MAELAEDLAELAASDSESGDAAATATEATSATEPRADSPIDSPIVGTYRSHDPWTTTFRVVRRGDVTWLCFWSPPDGFDDEQPLVPLDGDLSYRVGEDPLGPERLGFDTVIDGHTVRAWLSGWDYDRTGDA